MDFIHILIQTKSFRPASPLFLFQPHTFHQKCSRIIIHPAFLFPAGETKPAGQRQRGAEDWSAGAPERVCPEHITQRRGWVPAFSETSAPPQWLYWRLPHWCLKVMGWKATRSQRASRNPRLPFQRSLRPEKTWWVYSNMQQLYWLLWHCIWRFTVKIHYSFS